MRISDWSSECALPILQQAMKIGTLEIGLDQSLDMRHDLRGRRNVGSEKAVKIDGRTFGIVLGDRDHQPSAIAEIIADERDIRPHTLPAFGDRDFDPPLLDHKRSRCGLWSARRWWFRTLGPGWPPSLGQPP